MSFVLAAHPPDYKQGLDILYTVYIVNRFGVLCAISRVGATYFFISWQRFGYYHCFCTSFGCVLFVFVFWLCIYLFIDTLLLYTMCIVLYK